MGGQEVDFFTYTAASWWRAGRLWIGLMGLIWMVDRAGDFMKHVKRI
jgi:hypothetical protein